MNQVIKRIASFAAAILIAATMGLPCFAATASVSDGLVVHWDFEGEGQEALSDKAPDAVRSNLEMGGNPVIANGTATVSETDGSYLISKGYEGFRNLESTTIYMKVKITATASNFECMFFVPGTSNKFRIMTGNGGQKGLYNIRAAAGHKPNLDSLNFGPTVDDKWNDGNWIYIALCFNGNAKDPMTRLYASPDGTNYSVVATDPNGSATTVSKIVGKEVMDLQLGNYNKDEPKATFEYDEVRIYNRDLSEKEIRAISQEPDFAGVQETAIAEDGTQSLRFLGTVDSLNYSEVGFKIDLKENDSTEIRTLKKGTGSVFGTLNAGANGELVSVTAKELGGRYLFALSIRNVPTNLGKLTFTVTPYAVNPEGEPVYGVPASVIYENGIFVSVNY